MRGQLVTVVCRCRGSSRHQHCQCPDLPRQVTHVQVLAPPPPWKPPVVEPVSPDPSRPRWSPWT